MLKNDADLLAVKITIEHIRSNPQAFSNHLSVSRDISGNINTLSKLFQETIADDFCIEKVLSL